uniref:Na_Ca_ex domain-containing protein n=1 Tax=Mesocestoides corti TaxID=53468 RepID=A0A5K3FCG9_MESCO
MRWEKCFREDLSQICAFRFFIYGPFCAFHLIYCIGLNSSNFFDIDYKYGS